MGHTVLSTVYCTQVQSTVLEDSYKPTALFLFILTIKHFLGTINPNSKKV